MYAQRDASFRTVRGSNQSVDVINISACSHAHHYSEINENRHPQKRLNLVNSRGYLENGTSGYFSGDPSSSAYGSYYSSSTASSYENVLRDISVIINTRKSDFTFPTQVDMLAIVANHSEPLLQEVMQQLKYYGKKRPEEKVSQGFSRYDDANKGQVLTSAHTTS